MKRPWRVRHAALLGGGLLLGVLVALAPSPPGLLLTEVATPLPARGTIAVSEPITTIGAGSFTIRITGGPPSTKGLICGTKNGVAHCDTGTHCGPIETDATGSVTSLNDPSCTFDCTKSGLPNPEDARDEHVEWLDDAGVRVSRTNSVDHLCQTACTGTRVCNVNQRQCKDAATAQTCNPTAASGCGAWVDLPACLTSCSAGVCVGPFAPDGSGDVASPLAWVPGDAGSIGRFAAAWKTATCATPDAPEPCEVDSPSVVALHDVEVAVVDGTGPDLRLYSTSGWAPVQVFVEGKSTPVATLNAQAPGTSQDVSIGSDDGKAYTKVTLKLALDHSKGPVNFELAALRALNGGSGDTVSGLTTEQLTYNGGGASFSAPPEGAANCTDATGTYAYYLPDGSLKCTNAPGVWLDLPTGVAYVPTWTQPTCACATTRRARCVVRDPTAYADLVVQRVFKDQVGPDIKASIPASNRTVQATKFRIPGSSSLLTATGTVQVKTTGRWIPGLLFGGALQRVELLGTDTVGLQQLVDFRRDDNSSSNGFVLRATNAGSYCGGLVLADVTPADPTPPAPGGTAVCGNGVREGAELCDRTDLGGMTCLRLGYVNGGQLRCAATSCRFSTLNCTPPEPNLPVIPPPSVPPPPPPPPAIPRCGDNILQGNEVCDTSNLGGKLCSNFGYIGGELRCDNRSCASYDTSRCRGKTTTTSLGCEPGTPGCAADQVSVAPSDAPLGSTQGLGIRQASNWLTSIAGAIAVLYVVYGGLQYIGAGTDEQRLRRARRTIRNAMVGVVVVLLSYVIVLGVLRLAYGAG